MCVCGVFSEGERERKKKIELSGITHLTVCL